MALLSRAKELEAQGRDIVHMEIGEPDFPTPEPILAAAEGALRKRLMHYTPALGLPGLREAISRHYRNRYGVDVSSKRIVVTTGGSGALLLALGALVNPGQEVLVTDPGYPCNRNFVQFVGGVPCAVPVTAATNYQLTPELVERHWTSRSAAVMLASPSNPTGTVMAQDGLRDVLSWISRQGGAVIVDEIYHGLVYGTHIPTALQFSDDVFVVNSFSKYFQMTGWRLGWLVVPEAFVPHIDKLAQNLFLAAPTPAQYAALSAFDSATIAILEQRRAEFQRRRDFLVPELQKLGFQIPVIPDGAFYVYANSAALAPDSFELTRRILEEAGVAFTPGIDFGKNAPEQHVRFAYTTSVARLQEGVQRLAAAL